MELITAPTDNHDITLPALTAEAVLKADAKEPTEQMLNADPVDPILSTEPREAIDSTDPSDRSDHNDDGIPTSGESADHLYECPTLAHLQVRSRYGVGTAGAPGTHTVACA